ncbi:MAG: ATP-binding protein [Terricaulis sp.]
MSARKFLILDDSASERHIMAHVLSDVFPGADIHQCGDAAAARDLCATTSFDCILLDYNMPQMDGITFAEQIRAIHPHVPLVLVTGVGDEMLVSQALRSGISDYIPKARINPESIQRTIERAIKSCALTRTIEEQRDELENFAYALAHDFKQPIRQIRTFTQLISAQIGDEGKESVQQHLDFLNQAARRLSDLVDVMSQYTLLNQPPELKTIALGTVIDNVRDALRAYLFDRGAELTFEGSAWLTGNETLMGQVLQNLIVNGVKYNKSESPRVEVRANPIGDRCIITIRDNGIGIDPQYLTEVFRPLMRLHTAAEYTGTGLGLTLARKAVNAQGGAIWCESEVGVGSTFYVRIPVAREHRVPAAKAAS